MKQVTKDWIEAGKALSIDPSGKVACPVCKIGILKAEDIAVPEHGIVERKICCDNCGAYNYILKPI
jgi:hypothetical protein